MPPGADFHNISLLPILSSSLEAMASGLPPPPMGLASSVTVLVDAHLKEDRMKRRRSSRSCKNTGSTRRRSVPSDCTSWQKGVRPRSSCARPIPTRSRMRPSALRRPLPGRPLRGSRPARRIPCWRKSACSWGRLRLAEIRVC